MGSCLTAHVFHWHTTQLHHGNHVYAQLTYCIATLSLLGKDGVSSIVANCQPVACRSNNYPMGSALDDNALKIIKVAHLQCQ